MLVSGTLVYSRGDEKEAQRLEEEVAPAPEAESLLPSRDGPTAAQAVPVAGSAPISMRQTPSSFKAGTPPCTVLSASHSVHAMWQLPLWGLGVDRSRGSTHDCMLN